MPAAKTERDAGRFVFVDKGGCSRRVIADGVDASVGTKIRKRGQLHFVLQTMIVTGGTPRDATPLRIFELGYRTIVAFRSAKGRLFAERL